MASPTQWTWVWVDSGGWWWTGRPGVLWFMGSQRVRHNWATELNWNLKAILAFLTPFIFPRWSLNYLTLLMTSIRYIKSSSWPEHQFLIHPISIHPVSIGHSYDALQIPLTHHFQRQINEFFFLFQIHLLPVFTILVKRTTVKSILKDRKLEVLSFPTSNWSPNPIDSTLLLSLIYFFFLSSLLGFLFRSSAFLAWVIVMAS